MRFRTHAKWVAAAVLGVAGGGAAVSVWMASKGHTTSESFDAIQVHRSDDLTKRVLGGSLPTRTQHLRSLKEKTFDVLIIGGGATGCGVALDAVSRGLSTALVERYDFASGTSSKSTKLIHGGVRYLQKAILDLDIEQYRMVKEALSERANLIKIAPHLVYSLPIMLPVYKWWQVPYYYAGIKCYDLVAGRELLETSYILSKEQSLELFPMLRKDKLIGALVYYDGQQDDARVCLALALTSARLGASIVNYTEVVELIKTTDDGGHTNTTVKGAKVKDHMTGETFEVHAKCVVNATGPYTDFVRQMDSPQGRKICQPSSGVHVVLPKYYSPSNMGLLDPQTSDGRVIFFLPWQNATMAGTTDNECVVTNSPSPSDDEIQFILNEVRRYLSPDINVRRGDVLSAWSGIRPLVTSRYPKDTQSIARNHIIEVSNSNMITIAGGRWTTYRLMAEQTVDKCVEVCQLKAGKTATRGLLLEGAHRWTPTMFIRLIQDFGLDHEVALHLSNSYGDKAFEVAKLAKLTGKRWPVVGKRLCDEYPFIEAEVIYACREYACTCIDVIARRTRLAFLNVLVAEEVLPTIVDIMARELGWSNERKKQERADALNFLMVEMGLHLTAISDEEAEMNMSDEVTRAQVQRFTTLDSDIKRHTAGRYWHEATVPGHTATV